MKHKRRKHISDTLTLSKNRACYVLISCGEPSADGNMDVEMTYEGDLSLASYLLQGAQTFIDEKQDQENCG